MVCSNVLLVTSSVCEGQAEKTIMAIESSSTVRLVDGEREKERFQCLAEVCDSTGSLKINRITALCNLNDSSRKWLNVCLFYVGFLKCITVQTTT